MRLLILAVAAATFFVNPQAQERRGAVATVVASAADEYGTVQFTVRGTNPCGSLQVDFGDGTRVATYPIRQFPVTIAHDYPKVGTFNASIRGAGYCDGSVTTRVRVTRGASQPWTPPVEPPPPASANIRFAGMDRNNDGVITRAEWRGSAQSFAVHDWNRDGRLSGDEVRTGAAWPADRSTNDATTFRVWNREQFTALDRNGDGHISRFEWGKYDVEDFIRADRNGDNQLGLNEFLIAADVDDDRGDRFDYLDLDGNNRLDRTEWHGTAQAFQWLDRNGDGYLNRVEAMASDDIGMGRRAGTRQPARTVMVSAQTDWVDTGIDLRVNDVIEISATGQIFYAGGNDQFAGPNGAKGRPATPAAPIPYNDIGALIGKIGNSAPFEVGASLTNFRATTTGRLMLRVNDDRMDDNRGQFRATVTVTRR